MSVHPLAGMLLPHNMLANIPELMAAYYTESPDPAIPAECVAFGTSGHRGTSIRHTFNAAHIYAVTQAVCEFRVAQNITGPLFLGMDTHALSEAAYRTALEVLVANDVDVFVAPHGSFTPTPAVSHAILCWNRQHGHLADGIVITPSHNPPCDGGFKYNPPHGGPAESSITRQIEGRAHAILAGGNSAVRRRAYGSVVSSKRMNEYDFIDRYVTDLARVVDMDAIAASGLRLGVDPLGGASLQYWEPIADRYGLQLTVVSHERDPTFRFIPCDKDGKIRMDCSSPYAMGQLLQMKDTFDLAFGCDPDADRHGIVTSDGLMPPNHYLSVAAWYLFRNRPQWPGDAALGKTLVTSAMLDRVAASLGRAVMDVPVGFKWFVPYLHEGTCGFCCEESAGASFLCRDGTPWSTDKDGPLLCLLAAEIMAREGKSPAVLYGELTERLGNPVYERLDTPADPQTRAALLHLDGDQAHIAHLGGEPVTAIHTHAPGNQASMGGIKVETADGWFAARPSGTENICKLYAESFKGREHLHLLQQDATDLLARLLKKTS